MDGQKTERVEAIRDLLKHKRISSQEELLDNLRQMGFETTQATLSRDLREIKAIKVHDNMGYYYEASGTRKKNNQDSGKHPVKGIGTLEFSGNLAVIKTKPGFASIVASFVDSCEEASSIIGTVAGDDTAILVLKESASRNQIKSELMAAFKGIKSKLTQI